jgi:hypothetical protein
MGKRKQTKVAFRRTDDLGVMVRKLLKHYYKDRGKQLSRAELRRERTKLLVEIEKGARSIPLSAVRAPSEPDQHVS